MFEAHNLTADELKRLYEPAPCWQKTYCRTHQSSLRPLKIWFAEGKRKDAQQVPWRTRFVYIEYQDNRGNNCFYCLEVRIAGQSVAELLALAVSVPLAALDER